MVNIVNQQVIHNIAGTGGETTVTRSFNIDTGGLSNPALYIHVLFNTGGSNGTLNSILFNGVSAKVLTGNAGWARGAVCVIPSPANGDIDITLGFVTPNTRSIGITVLTLSDVNQTSPIGFFNPLSSPNFGLGIWSWARANNSKIIAAYSGTTAARNAFTNDGFTVETHTVVNGDYPLYIISKDVPEFGEVPIIFEQTVYPDTNQVCLIEIVSAGETTDVADIFPFSQKFYNADFISDNFPLTTFNITSTGSERAYIIPNTTEPFNSVGMRFHIRTQNPRVLFYARLESGGPGNLVHIVPSGQVSWFLTSKLNIGLTLDPSEYPFGLLMYLNPPGFISGITAPQLTNITTVTSWKLDPFELPPNPYGGNHNTNSSFTSTPLWISLEDYPNLVLDSDEFSIGSPITGYYEGLDELPEEFTVRDFLGNEIQVDVTEEPDNRFTLMLPELGTRQGILFGNTRMYITYNDEEISTYFTLTPPEGYSVTTLGELIYPYLFSSWSELPVPNTQLIINQDNGSFTDEGDYEGNVEGSFPYYVVDVSGYMSEHVLDWGDLESGGGPGDPTRIRSGITIPMFQGQDGWYSSESLIN